MALGDRNAKIISAHHMKSFVFAWRFVTAVTEVYSHRTIALDIQCLQVRLFETDALHPRPYFILLQSRENSVRSLIKICGLAGQKLFCETEVKGLCCDRLFRGSISSLTGLFARGLEISIFVISFYYYFIYFNRPVVLK